MQRKIKMKLVVDVIDDIYVKGFNVVIGE